MIIHLEKPALPRDLPSLIPNETRTDTIALGNDPIRVLLLHRRKAHADYFVPRRYIITEEEYQKIRATCPNFYSTNEPDTLFGVPVEIR